MKMHKLLHSVTTTSTLKQYFDDKLIQTDANNNSSQVFVYPIPSFRSNSSDMNKTQYHSNNQVINEI